MNKKSIYKKCLIIYNPTAGQGLHISPVFNEILGAKKINISGVKKDNILDIIVNHLEEYHIPVDVSLTKSRGHGTEIAKSAVFNSYDLVVAVGGDGTINEVINGLANSEVVLGIIPLGTVNVLGIQLGLPDDIRKICEIIASGKRKKIDLGRVNERYFASIAGIGFDAYIVKKTDSRLKKIFGAFSYLFVALSELLFYRFKKITLKIDDQPIPRKGYFVIIVNGKYYGGELVVADKADISDGYLDVCIFKHKSLSSIISYMFSLRSGKIYKNMDVEYYQCKKILIFKQGRHPVHVDAEYYGKTPVKIEVCPKALTIAA